MLYVPSTARSFRDGTPTYCPLWRTWSSGFYTVPTGNWTPGHRVAAHYTTAAPRQLHSRFKGRTINVLLTNQSQLSPRDVTKALVRGAQLHIVKYLKSLCRLHWHQLAWRLPVSYHAYLFYLTWRILADAYTWISNIMCKLSKPSLLFFRFLCL